MQLQIRDPRDPFTQTLAFLFKNAEDPLELKRKIGAGMVPLVTQVAIKIGGIDTEKSVRDRSLPVFTGIISLHLANFVHGRDCNVIEEWTDQIATHDLGLLFRKGYTLLDELVKNTHTASKNDPFIRAQSFAERMQEYATHNENGIWAGFKLYKEKMTSYTGERTLQEFAEWLCKKARTPINSSKLAIEDDLDIPETMVSRVVINVLHDGNVSTDLNFMKVRDIVDAARTDKEWWARAERHYAAFAVSLPEKFRQELDGENDTSKAMACALNMAKRLTNRRTSRYKNIDYVCLMTGLTPPGLTKEARSMFPA